MNCSDYFNCLAPKVERISTNLVSQISQLDKSQGQSWHCITHTDTHSDKLGSLHKGQAPRQRTEISTCSCKIVSAVQHAFLPKPERVAEQSQRTEILRLLHVIRSQTHLLYIGHTQYHVYKDISSSPRCCNCAINLLCASCLQKQNWRHERSWGMQVTARERRSFIYKRGLC